MDKEYKISVRGRLVEGLRWRGEVLKDKGWGCSWPGRRIVDALLLPSDIQTIRKQYLKQFGVTPRLIFSKTFNEKLQRSKLFHRPPRYIQYADKIRAGFCTKAGGAGNLKRAYMERCRSYGCTIDSVAAPVYYQGE